jgi:CO/xanthine dehydrogenase Mo-binding subunit
MSVQAIGQPVRREEDLRLLKGRGRYVDDVREPAKRAATSCVRRMRMGALLHWMLGLR